MPPKPSPVRQAPPAFDVQAFLKSAGMSPRTVRFATGAVVFAQGGQANSVFYVQEGGVKLSVLSSAGKEAVVAMLGPGDFFGEGCLAGQPLRMGTANAVMRTACCESRSATWCGCCTNIRNSPTDSSPTC